MKREKFYSMDDLAREDARSEKNGKTIYIFYLDRVSGEHIEEPVRDLSFGKLAELWPYATFYKANA